MTGGPPLADHITTMCYVELQAMIDALAPPGRQNCEKAHFLASISDGAIETLVDHFENVTSPHSAALIQQTVGEMRRGAGEGAAYAHRDANYNFTIFTAWLDPGKSEIHIQWARNLWKAMKPFTTGGVYMNDIGREVEEGADLMRAAYWANYQRLVDLKNKYEPHNLFRHNQNIKPTV